MNIIVDTNIVFSALVKTNGKIGDLILRSENYFKYYSCRYLLQEIANHRDKLIKASQLSEFELIEIEYLVFDRITFLSEEQIPKPILYRSIELVKDIDLRDVLFIALGKHLNCKVWTGDKKLINGLKKKGYNELITTDELFLLREKMIKGY